MASRRSNRDYDEEADSSDYQRDDDESEGEEREDEGSGEEGEETVNPDAPSRRRLKVPPKSGWVLLAIGVLLLGYVGYVKFLKPEDKLVVENDDKKAPVKKGTKPETGGAGSTKRRLSSGPKASPGTTTSGGGSTTSGTPPTSSASRPAASTPSTGTANRRPSGTGLAAPSPADENDGQLDGAAADASDAGASVVSDDEHWADAEDSDTEYDVAASDEEPATGGADDRDISVYDRYGNRGATNAGATSEEEEHASSGDRYGSQAASAEADEDDSDPTAIDGVGAQALVSQGRYGRSAQGSVAVDSDLPDAATEEDDTDIDLDPVFTQHGRPPRNAGAGSSVVPRDTAETPAEEEEPEDDPTRITGIGNDTARGNFAENAGNAGSRIGRGAPATDEVEDDRAGTSRMPAGLSGRSSTGSLPSQRAEEPLEPLEDTRSGRRGADNDRDDLEPLPRGNRGGIAVAPVSPERRQPEEPLSANDRGDRAHRVRRSETFWSIAESTYGDGRLFRALQEYNRDLGRPVERLREGDTLYLPPQNVLKQDYADYFAESRPAPRRAATGSRPAANVHVVAEGESLFDIARVHLGKASRWVEIYELNQATLGEDFDQLIPGTELRLPERRPAATIGRSPSSLRGMR